MDAPSTRTIGMCVGTRGGVGRMRGPRACPRPVGLPTYEHPEYHRNRTPPQAKHKAPSPPFHRPLSLRAINPILFVFTQCSAGNNICTLETYETANNLNA